MEMMDFAWTLFSSIFYNPYCCQILYTFHCLETPMHGVSMAHPAHFMFAVPDGVSLFNAIPPVTQWQSVDFNYHIITGLYCICTASVLHLH